MSVCDSQHKAPGMHEDSGRSCLTSILTTILDSAVLDLPYCAHPAWAGGGGGGGSGGDGDGGNGGAPTWTGIYVAPPFDTRSRRHRGQRIVAGSSSLCEGRVLVQLEML